jgi:site-specific DNA recombinase
LECDTELVFVDDGYSGSSLARPALQRLREQAAAGAIDRLYILTPDRLSRQCAHHAFLLEDLARGGVKVIFVSGPRDRGSLGYFAVEVDL